MSKEICQEKCVRRNMFRGTYLLGGTFKAKVTRGACWEEYVSENMFGVTILIPIIYLELLIHQKFVADHLWHESCPAHNLHHSSKSMKVFW